MRKSNTRRLEIATLNNALARANAQVAELNATLSRERTAHAEEIESLRKHYVERLNESARRRNEEVAIAREVANG